MILNEFFNLPPVFEKDMNEFDTSGYDRYSIYMDDYDLKEKFSDLDDAVEAIEAYKRDDPKSRYADYNVRDLNGKVVWRNDAWQDVSKPGKIQFLPRNDQGVEEGIFGSRPSPVLPIVDKIAKVARGLTPQNVEVGKQIIQANARDITRMLSPQTKAGVDVIEQGVAEGKPKEKEADYGADYQAMVQRVGQKAKQQELAKKKQQEQPKAPVRESRLALLKQIIQS